MPSDRHPLPVSIIGGYLGSGKTTLINYLLRNANGRRLAIMVNEFGDLPIDAGLIEAQGDDLISLSGGCICCSYNNDMINALNKLSALDPPPDHVILEASGVAIPSMIASSISLLTHYKLNGIISLLDARTIRKQAEDTYLSDTITRQLEDSDMIIVNKSDLISEQAYPLLEQWLRNKMPHKNPKTPILSAINAKVPLQIIIQDFAHTNAGFHTTQKHRLSEFNTQIIQPSKVENLEIFIARIMRETTGLIRAKGFLQDEKGEFKTIQIVGDRLDISSAPKDVEVGLVLICKPE